MAASRKRLFGRGVPEHPVGALDLRALLAVARLGLLTAPQLAALEDLSEKAARNHLRNLYDHGLLERAGVTRTQLSSVGGNDLLFGSAPLVYSLSRDGFKALLDGQLLAPSELADAPAVTTKSLFVAHELLVRDVRVWLARLGRAYPQHRGVLHWSHGTRCTIELGRAEYPRQCRPDARFTWGLGEATLAAFVEADRGTETSPARWEEKVAQYAPVLTTDLVRTITGYKAARVLVIAPDAARRDWIATVLARSLPASGVRADRFWVAQQDALACADLTAPLWRVPGMDMLRALIDAEHV